MGKLTQMATVTIQGVYIQSDQSIVPHGTKMYKVPISLCIIAVCVVYIWFTIHNGRYAPIGERYASENKPSNK